MTNENGSPFTMPVIPYGGYGGNGGGFGNGGDWWGILLLIALLNGGFGWGMGGGMGGMMWPMMMGGMGGFGMDYLYPWLNNSEHISDGFRDAQLHDTVTSIGDKVVSGFGDVQAQLYNNEIASLNRSFAEQTANTQGFSGLQAQLAQCCCDNRLATVQTQNIVQVEAAATRAAGTDNTQKILDKLCQLELDGVRGQLAQAQRENVGLQNQLNMAAFRESQTAQNAFIAQGLNNEVDALYNRLSNCPVPTTPVYGRTPIFTCGGNNGCGCGGNGFMN